MIWGDSCAKLIDNHLITAFSLIDTKQVLLGKVRDSMFFLTREIRNVTDKKIETGKRKTK